MRKDTSYVVAEMNELVSLTMRKTLACRRNTPYVEAENNELVIIIVQKHASMPKNHISG